MLNVAALNGRLTADPELRHTNGDIPVTSFALAVDRSYIQNGAERKADFIDIVCWRSTAEFAAKYFRKGQLVAVEGAIETGSYTDTHGVKRRSFQVNASRVHFAESKKPVDEADVPADIPTAGSPSTDNDPGDFVEIDGDDDLPF